MKARNITWLLQVGVKVNLGMPKVMINGESVSSQE